MEEIHITIRGHVQGVFFRALVRDKAGILGIKGFVRNLPNGDVEIMAQGSEKALNELVKLCRKGPLGAKVDKIKTKKQKIKEKFSSFEIK